MSRKSRKSRSTRKRNNLIEEETSYSIEKFSSKKKYSEKEQSIRDLRFKVSAITEAQGQLIAQMISNTITFGIGPAGTGKTMVTTCYAAELLHSKQYDKIILTRPIVEIGRTIGHLPGDMNEKYEPYIAPFRQYLIDSFGKSGFEARLGKSIIPVPINFCQGQTWDNAIILLDEVQNMTEQELYMVLTRTGKNSKLFITGDLKQTATSNLKFNNGLSDFLERFENTGIFEKGDISVVEFTVDDVVRSDIVGKIIRLYN